MVDAIMPERLRIVIVAMVLGPISVLGSHAQEFNCELEGSGGGVVIYGTNSHDRVLRCQVICDAETVSGSINPQTCKTQLNPETYDVRLCAWNLNGAPRIIGIKHSCS